jgi:hypothetical protein
MPRKRHPHATLNAIVAGVAYPFGLNHAILSAALPLMPDEGQSDERPVPSKGARILTRRTNESHEGPRRSIRLAYIAFNPFSVVLRGPRSSSVLESLLADYPTARDGWTFTRLPCQMKGNIVTYRIIRP